MLNLIIGEKVLPEHLLSSTACICQIFNSVEKKAIAIKEDESQIPIDVVTDEKLKEYVCVEKSGQNKQLTCSKRVDIFWPIPMLKVKQFCVSNFRYLCFVRVYFTFDVAVLI